MIRVLADLLPAWGTDTLLLLLLLAGHLLGDFLFQTGRMARRKASLPVLVGHAITVMAVHLVLVLPFLGLPVVVAVAGLGGLHLIIDWIKTRWPWKRPGRLGLFLLDQGAHVLVLLGAFHLLITHFEPPLHLDLETTRVLAAGSVLLGTFAFNWTGGGAIVSAILTRLSPTLEDEEEASSGVVGSGWLIGVLERTLTLLLILAGQWAAIMILLAAKSIARFEELKQRRFAEYYLVGTLASLLVAIVSGLVLRALLAGVG